MLAFSGLLDGPRKIAAIYLGSLRKLTANAKGTSPHIIAV